MRCSHHWTSAPSITLLSALCQPPHVFIWLSKLKYFFTLVLLHSLCVSDLEVQRMKKAVESLMAANEEKVLPPIFITFLMFLPFG